MFDKILENLKPEVSFRFMNEITVALSRLEEVVNHNKTKYIYGDQSEANIWEAILNILENRIQKK